MQAEHLDALFNGINPEWMKLFKKNADLRTTLGSAIKQIKTTDPAIICPSYDKILECFRYFAPQDTKVVIMGQDPYFGVGEATGLCFSVGNDKMTPSLRNISAAIQKSCGQKINDIKLIEWAQQGVLMLNARLTTVLTKAKEDGHDVWEAFTDKIIEWLDANVDNIIFVLWGNNAKAKGAFIKRSKILTYTHPSPMADKSLPRDKRFANCGHFTEINAHLTANGGAIIKWGDDIEIKDVGDTSGDNNSNTSNDISNTSNDKSNNKEELTLRACTNNLSTSLRACTNKHIVFVDGACTGNGKRSARASYAFYIAAGPLAPYEQAAEIGNYNNVTATNNRGELLAFINALKYINEAPVTDNVKTILFISDSSYCIGIIGGWLDSWIAKGILHEKMNGDLLRELIDIIKKIKDKDYKIDTIHQYSHQPAPVNKDSDEYYKWQGNDKVDKLATSCL